MIVDRGRPVARLERVMSARELDPEGRLARLVRDGVVRPARASLPEELFAEQPPSIKRGTSAVAALLRERREGR